MSFARLVKTTTLLAATLTCIGLAPAADKSKYATSDWLVTMMDQIAKHIGDTKKFKEVLKQNEKPAQSGAATVKLSGTVTQYKAGNRAVRYMVGFGAGKTKITANVRFVDAVTGNTLLEKTVDGKVWIGVLGGDSVGATKGLAKELAKLAKKL
jgi:curli biogenesis system outer membrane secretion channel CsgG